MKSTRNLLLCSLSLTVTASLMSTEQSQYVYEWSPYVSTSHCMILLQDFLFSPSSSPLNGLFWFRIRSAFFITLCIHVLILFTLWTSRFLFVPFLTSLSTSHLLCTLHFARPLSPFYCSALTSKMSSFHAYILPSDPSPTSFHPSRSHSCITPPIPASLQR